MAESETREGPLPASRNRARYLSAGLMLPVFIVILAVGVGLIEPRFWSEQNLTNLLRQLAPLLILTVGPGMTIIAGGLDLSVAAVVIGGTALTGGLGTMTGIVSGAVIPGMRFNSLKMIGVSSFYQTTSIGVIIIVAVILDRFRNRR